MVSGRSEVPVATGAADASAYHLVIDHPRMAPGRRSLRRSACVGAGLLLGGALFVASGGSSGVSTLPLLGAREKSPAHHPVEIAHVVIIRHGEKHDGDGLSADGKARARYLQRCMTSPYASVALPLGKPTYVMASHGKPGKSHRPQDTAYPIAQTLRLKLDDDLYFGDAEGFAKRVQHLLGHGATVLVAWHHNEIHSLVQQLLDGEEWKKEALGYRDAWPHNCGDEARGAPFSPAARALRLRVCNEPALHPSPIGRRGAPTGYRAPNATTSSGASR